MSSIYAGEKPRIIGATIYALNRTHGLAPARGRGADETVVEVINDYSGLIRTDAGNVYSNGDFGIKRYAEDAPTWPATAIAGTATPACYHPRSCIRCQRAGVCCGGHYVGDAGHERCTGTHA